MRPGTSLRWLLSAAMSLALAGCGIADGGTPGPVVSELCSGAVAEAATIAASEASESDLDLAIRRCRTLDEFRLAVAARPEGLRGAFPVDLLEARCEDPVAELAGYAVCGQLRAANATPSPTRKPRPRPTERPIRDTRSRRSGDGPRAADTSDRSVTRRTQVRSYADCDALNAVYPHGVGKPGARDRVRGSSAPVTDFVRSLELYQANTGRDGDGDGVACEKR